MKWKAIISIKIENPIFIFIITKLGTKWNIVTNCKKNIEILFRWIAAVNMYQIFFLWIMVAILQNDLLKCQIFNLLWSKYLWFNYASSTTTLMYHRI